MNNEPSEPPKTWNGGRIIPVGQEPPPMETEEDRRRKAERSAQTEVNAGKTEGKAKRQRGRFAVLNGFVDSSMADLSRAEIATWMVLYRDTRDGTVCTSAEDIGRRIGTSKRGVLDAVAKLQRRGLVQRVYRGGLNRGPSVYRVHPVPP